MLLGLLFGSCWMQCFRHLLINRSLWILFRTRRHLPAKNITPKLGKSPQFLAQQPSTSATLPLLAAHCQAQIIT
jgi:hypothetical protein